MLLQKMSDNAFSNASWGLLPAELLEKIFESVPWLMLGKTLGRYVPIGEMLFTVWLSSS
jgi:hypothetical protein